MKRKKKQKRLNLYNRRSNFDKMLEMLEKMDENSNYKKKICKDAVTKKEIEAVPEAHVQELEEKHVQELLEEERAQKLLEEERAQKRKTLRAKMQKKGNTPQKKLKQKKGVAPQKKDKLPQKETEIKHTNKSQMALGSAYITCAIEEEISSPACLNSIQHALNSCSARKDLLAEALEYSKNGAKANCIVNLVQALIGEIQESTDN